MCGHAPMVRADIGGRLPLLPGGLYRAIRCLALPVEGTVSVLRVSRVDTERCVIVCRGHAGVFHAVGGIAPDSSDRIVAMLPVAVRHPTFLVGLASHRTGSPVAPGARHEDVDDLGPSSRFDRWALGLSIDIDTMEQCP